MASFAYTARAKAGGILKGSIVAVDKPSAAASLMEKGIVPILIKEEVAGQTKGRGLVGLLNFRKGHVKLQDKVIFSRQFATMINAGVPIAQSLGTLREQTQSKPLQKAIDDIAKKVEGGTSLSLALSNHTEIFSPIYISMVQAGETGGILDQVLDRLAVQQEKDAEIVSKVKGAMIYPAVVTTVTIVAFIFLMTVIVPRLAVVFDSLGGKLPVYTKIMLGISSALIHYGWLMAIGAIGGGVLLYRYTKVGTGRRWRDRLLVRAPIFGTIIVKTNVARFARTFGSLMASGIAVMDALNTTSQSLGNMTFRDELANITKQIKQGHSLSDSMRGSQHFPPIVAQMTGVGEETGKLDEILLKLADFYEKEVDAVVASLTSVIEPVLILILGAMVGSVVISVFGPIATLSQTIQS